MEEWDFVNEIARQANCKVLLDINNIYVSSRNHGFRAEDYLDAINPQYVQQFHLAGHSDFNDYVIDTHDNNIVDPVWQLYRKALRRFGAVSAMIERDDHIPPFDDIYAEYEVMRSIALEEIPSI